MNVLLQEAAIMVTLPTNISQIIIGYIGAYLGDWATKRHVPTRHKPKPSNEIHQCCGSGMFILDSSDCFPSRIPDLGFQIQQKQKEKGNINKLIVLPYFVAFKFYKIEKHYIF
jgi:hypothetical protein